MGTRVYPIGGACPCPAGSSVTGLTLAQHWGATMARKLLDCREMPSESGCTLTLAGEEDEVIRAGAAHAVDVHGHVDNAELRDALRAGLRDADAEPNTRAGAFLQLIEIKTRRIDDVFALDD